MMGTSVPSGQGGLEGPAHLPGGIDEHTVFRSLFAAYPDALLVVDAAGAIVLANPSAASMLGYTVAELVGSNIDALVPDAIRPRHAAYRESYSHSPRARPMGTRLGTQMELVARRRDGSEVTVEIALSPLQSLGLPLVVAAIRSIAAYPRVKQAVHRARYGECLAKFGQLAVDSRDALLLVDQVPAMAAEALQVEVCIVSLLEPNHLEFKIVSGVGLLPLEPVGSTVDNANDTLAGLILASGQPLVVADYSSESRFPVPAAWLAAGLASGLGVPLSDRGRVIGALTARSREVGRFGDDETRFLEALANMLATSLQRAHSEEALNHAQRLESVGQLTGGIAHDFNNLLTVIQGNLQVLEELPGLANDAHAQQLVDAAARAARRGAELTGKLLAFSRRQILRPTAVDVGALLHSLANMLQRTLDEHIRIELDVLPCAACLADAGQLEAALLNIAINARDAMPEGGRLRFTAGVCEALPPGLNRQLDTEAGPDARYVSIAVADNGLGMSNEVMERAFEPFFTTKEAGRGTGLGLSTVHGFIQQSKGAISIQSRRTSGGAGADRGTTVTLYIPVDEMAATAGAPSAVQDPIRPGLRVLLVEDDPEVRAVAMAFLQTLGCVSTEFSNGEQALLGLARDTQDLLLTDIALGAGMRGTQLAALAQVRAPSLRVLLMSGFSAELLAADRESPAEWALLSKPYSREELAQAIARAMH